MLKEWLNPKYQNENKINKIKNNFLKSKPYQNFALNDFFNKGKLLQLKKEIAKEKFEKIDKDLFSLSHTKDLISSKSKIVKEFCQLLSSKKFI